MGLKNLHNSYFFGMIYLKLYFIYILKLTPVHKNRLAINSENVWENCTHKNVFHCGFLE